MIRSLGDNKSDKSKSKSKSIIQQPLVEEPEPETPPRERYLRE